MFTVTNYILHNMNFYPVLFHNKIIFEYFPKSTPLMRLPDKTLFRTEKNIFNVFIECPTKFYH